MVLSHIIVHLGLNRYIVVIFRSPFTHSPALAGAGAKLMHHRPEIPPLVPPVFIPGHHVIRPNL